MDKTVAGLIGAVAALATATPQPASAAAVFETAMQASSYADLLKPIPNALDLMRASAEASEAGGAVRSTAEGGATVQPVQYYHHHHHHHHHRYRRRYYRHHHHHHDYYR